MLGTGVIFRRSALFAATLLVLVLVVRALPAGAQGNGFECVDGQAGPYPCANMDLAATLTLPSSPASAATTSEAGPTPPPTASTRSSAR